MSCKLVFKYFDVPGLGESVRLALAMSGQPWEDKRIDEAEFYSTLKPSKCTPHEKRGFLLSHDK